MTQRRASNRLDLPQPFGPTTAVRPGSICSSVGSTKDLKPWSLRRVNFNDLAPLRYWLARYFFASSESNFDLISSQVAPGVWTSPLMTKVGVPLILNRFCASSATAMVLFSVSLLLIH